MTVTIGDMTLQSHVLIVKNDSLQSLLNWAIIQGLTEFSVSKEEDKFQLCHPLRVDEREEYKWLYHKMKRLTPDNDDPKGPPTGPKGGGPSGSPAGGSVGRYQDTIAIAA